MPKQEYKSIKATLDTYTLTRVVAAQAGETIISRFYQLAVYRLAQEIAAQPETDRPDWYRRLRGELLGD
jgi:hypothetical protein